MGNPIVLGGVSSPGVLGYRHTGNTGNLTVTLRLLNGTGAPLTSLGVSYLGRVNDTEEGRSPEWAVAINGVTPVVAESLNYSTLGNVDATIAKTVTVNILAGAEFTITWISSRGAGSLSSKQIGIGNVLITSTNPPATAWTTASSISWALRATPSRPARRSSPGR